MAGVARNGTRIGDDYDVRIEANDLIQVLIATGISQAIFLGTSRGGLIAMALGAVKPSLIEAVVLNDIGPVIEGKGIARIKGYVGKLPPPRDFAEAGQMLKQISEAQFPKYTDAQWRRLAEGTWREDDGRLVLRYDPALMRMLEAIDLGMPLPDLWPLFEGLGPFPVLAIRGANSDMLSAQTLRMMAERHPVSHHPHRPRRGPCAGNRGQARRRHHRIHPGRGKRTGESSLGQVRKRRIRDAIQKSPWSRHGRQIADALGS